MRILDRLLRLAYLCFRGLRVRFLGRTSEDFLGDFTGDNGVSFGGGEEDFSNLLTLAIFGVLEVRPFAVRFNLDGSERARPDLVVNARRTTPLALVMAFIGAIFLVEGRKILMAQCDNTIKIILF